MSFLLHTDPKAPLNAGGTIIIKNVEPKDWDGQQFNVGIYKDNRLLVLEEDIAVDSQVNITLKPVLYFAIVYNARPGEIISLDEITGESATFDLDKYPLGLEVKLTKKQPGGKYIFTGREMDFQ